MAMLDFSDLHSFSDAYLEQFEDGHKQFPFSASASRRGSFDLMTLRVLVVDDDRTTCSIAARIFLKLGYPEVVTATSGRQVMIELQNDSNFSFVLSDIHMPDVNGFEFMSEVRKLYPDLPVIMMSSTEDLTMVYKCLKLGAEHYVIKPLKEEILKSVWQTVYKQRKEKEIQKQLNAEREKAQRLEQEVANLKEDVARAAELPVTLLTRHLEAFLTDSKVPVELVLTTMLKQLNKVELYQSAFSRVMSAKDVNPNARKWMMDELDPANTLDKLYQPEPDELDPANTFDKLYQPEPDVGTIINQMHTQGWPKLDVLHTHTQLRSWDFDVWQYSEEQLLTLVVEMFRDFDLIEKFNIPEDKLINFLRAVKHNYYRRNPYHCFRHAFDVMQTLYVLLTECDAVSYLTYLDILAVFVAAIVHDVGHRGVNNAFHCAAATSIAATYNDRSVLENFHAMRAFQLMSEPETDILEGLSREQRKDVRSHIITAVLATDLASHHAILARFEAKLATVDGRWVKDDKECRSLTMELLLKCSDISNPAKPVESAKYWANLVQEEFFYQGDLEMSRGLPVSPFMNRNSPSLPRMQINFINFMVRPLLDSLVKIVPKAQVLLDTLQSNVKLWQTLEMDPGAQARVTSTIIPIGVARDVADLHEHKARRRALGLPDVPPPTETVSIRLLSPYDLT